MTQFVFVYLGGNEPSSPEEAKNHYTKYMEWMTSLGDSVISPTIPLKNTHTVNPAGEIREGGGSAMSGFTIIKADSLDDALSIAQACPFLEIGGTLEVSELMQMPN